MDLTKLSKPELLAKCEEFGFTKYKSKCKKDLISLITQKIEDKEDKIIEDKKDKIIEEYKEESLLNKKFII